MHLVAGEKQRRHDALQQHGTERGCGGVVEVEGTRERGAELGSEREDCILNPLQVRVQGVEIVT